MVFFLRAAVGIIFLAVFVSSATRADEPRVCELDSKSETPRVVCSDGAEYYLEDPIPQSTSATGSFDVDCSYRAVLKPSNADAGVRRLESKAEMKTRLITEDLFRLANGERPKCYDESAVGEKRKREKEEEKLKSAIVFFNPGDSESFKGLGRFNPPAQCMDPQVHFKASEPPVQRKPKPKPTPSPSPSPVPSPTPDPKKYIRVTKPDPERRNRPQSEKRLALIEESKRYGIDPPPPVTAQNPNRPTTITDSILAATKPKKPDPQQQLEFCLGVDASASMTENIKDIQKTIKKLETGWNGQFPGGIKIRIIEFGQRSDMDRPDLREMLKNGKIPGLEKYVVEFKTTPGLAPKAAAVAECANGMSDYSQDTEALPTKRHIVVISDAVGEDVKGAPTEEQAGAMAKAKQATLTMINPDDLPIDPFQFDAPEGTKFETSKVEKPKEILGVKVPFQNVNTKRGHFTRVKTPSGELAWKDEDTKKLWFDPVKKHVNYEKAQAFCPKDQRPPTKEEFEAAEDNGIRDLLQDMKRGYFWSSSVRPVNDDDAYVFVGNDGYVSGYFRNVDDRSVRCVGQRASSPP